MKIGVITGSHRQNSQSEKVGQFIATQLQDKGADTWLFSLGGNPLPLWDESIWQGAPEWKALLEPLSAELASCDGFVVVSPEWHGQVPAGLKNFFLMWGKGELAHKPALIVAVSSSDGGAYPVAELRMSSYKNNRLCYIPEHIIVRQVNKVLNDDPADNDAEADRYFRERIDWALNILKQYATAMQPIRESGVTYNEKYPFGM